jgi:3-hydroxyisobutyrate dehydrogenase-like beta-hydroxyacid dehydrogenase
MGEPMATRIAGAGHVVFASDVLPATQKLASPGVTHCPSAAVAAEDADVIVTSPPGPSEVSDVVLGSGGLRSALPRPAVLIETSTIAPDLSRTIASELTLREISYLDAPVSGGARGARDGLVAMVGGTGEALERARPIISCFAGSIFHLGPVGAGNTMKLVIQSIFLSQMTSFLESVSLGQRNGIPLQLLLDVVAASSAHHPAIGTRYEKLKSADLTPLFEIGSAEKDMSLVEELWSNLEFRRRWPRRSPNIGAWRSVAMQAPTSLRSAMAELRRIASRVIGDALFVVTRPARVSETSRDTPLPRAVQQCGNLASVPVLARIPHRNVRI